MVKKIIKHIPKPETTDENNSTENNAGALATPPPDEFQVKARTFVDWVQDHPAWVLSILGSIVIAGIAFGAVQSNKSNQAEGQSAQLAEAIKLTEPEENKEFPTVEKQQQALAAFESIASTQEYGWAATLFAGKTALGLNQWDKAQQSFQLFLDRTSADDPLKVAGYVGLAAAAEGKGDIPSAINHYETIRSLPINIEKDNALLQLGRLYKIQNKLDKAKEVWSTLKNDPAYASSSLRFKAEEYLIGL